MAARDKSPRRNDSSSTILRIKRNREDSALDVVAIEFTAKRPRLSINQVANIRLTNDSSGSEGRSDEQKRKRFIRFRRLDVNADNSEHVRRKIRYIDVAPECLRSVVEVDLSGVTVPSDSVSSLDTGHGHGAVQTAESEDVVDDAGAISGPRAFLGREELTCNGERMIRENRVIGGDKTSGDQKDSIVYDLYAREDISQEAYNDSFEITFTSPESLAVILADDLPDVEFLGDYSSDSLLPGTAPYDEDDPSDGSIDYPSTPDDDVYVHEIATSGSSSGDGDEDDDKIISPYRSRDQSATLFGFTRTLATESRDEWDNDAYTYEADYDEHED